MDPDERRFSQLWISHGKGNSKDLHPENNTFSIFLNFLTSNKELMFHCTIN
jgi:hypothetical protein